VLLVGFMGSGKTLVGQALADRLGWSFRDFDQEIKVRLGLPIPEIFRQHGEGRFREVEEEVGKDLLRNTRCVLASGGGWPAALGRMEALPPGTFSVWLKVTAEEAIRRIRTEGPTRPLLAVRDPVARARDLLESRDPYYAEAQICLDSMGGTPEGLAEEIERIMNHTGQGVSPTPPPPV
jgi:shikimate kinase